MTPLCDWDYALSGRGPSSRCHLDPLGSRERRREGVEVVSFMSPCDQAHMNATPITKILATTAAAWFLVNDARARAAKPEAASSRQH